MDDHPGGVHDKNGSRVRDAAAVPDGEPDRIPTHEHEELYRVLIDNVPAVLWKTDRSGHTDFISPNVEAVYGFTPQEIYDGGSDLFLGRIHPDDIGRVTQAWDRLWSGQGEFDLQYRIRHKDGHWLRLHDKATRIIGRENEPCLVGFFTDVTEKHRMREKLKSSEEKYYRLTENARDMIYRMLLPEGVYEYVSPASTAIFGYAPEEFYASPVIIKELLHPDWQGYFKEQWAKLLAGEVSPEYEYQIVHRSGETRWLNQRNVLIRDESGTPIALEGIVTDVTAHKRAEREKVRLEEQLLQARKMEAIGRLAGGIAHDFNNILTAILGYADALQGALGKNDPLYTDVEEIRSAGSRAAALTNQLLAFSRKQVISPKVISTNAVLRNAQRMLHRIIGEDIDLTFDPDARSAWIRMDPNQLDQVLVNLAVNARKAMPEGGKLAIETRIVHLDAPRLASHPDAAPGPYVLLSVSDSGAGMAPEVVEHIFEPFYSTRRDDGGTGLGLATVYGIVRQNHGVIDVRSRPGRGSTFEIYFPQVAQLPVQDPIACEALPEGQETILLVEDDDTVRGLAQRILEKQGYTVLQTGISRNACELGSHYDGDIQLLVTDVIMPGMNGRELYTELQKIRSGMKVLFMSGYTEEVIAPHGVLETGIHFLQKPFTTETLSQRVRQALDA